jgi:hypothetical protein
MRRPGSWAVERVLGRGVVKNASAGLCAGSTVLGDESEDLRRQVGRGRIPTAFGTDPFDDGR